MRPKRKALRELERRATKNHAKGLRDEQSRPRQKGPRRPLGKSQPRGPSFVDTLYDRLSGTIIKCLVWLYLAWPMLLDYIAVALAVVTIKEDAVVTQSTTEETASDTTEETAAETDSVAMTNSILAMSDTFDTLTTMPNTPCLSSPRSSISIDSPSGKSTQPTWYLQKFDEIDVQALRKCISNDHLERHVWARNDRDAVNHGSEEISCWWSVDGGGS